MDWGDIAALIAAIGSVITAIASIIAAVKASAVKKEMIELRVGLNQRQTQALEQHFTFGLRGDEPLARAEGQEVKVEVRASPPTIGAVPPEWPEPGEGREA